MHAENERNEGRLGLVPSPSSLHQENQELAGEAAANANGGNAPHIPDLDEIVGTGNRCRNREVIEVDQHPRQRCCGLQIQCGSQLTFTPAAEGNHPAFMPTPSNRHGDMIGRIDTGNFVVSKNQHRQLSVSRTPILTS